MCLYEIVAKMGKHMSDEYCVDIRTKCTIGSIAEHIWQHTLLRPLPKLRTEEEHKMWSTANKGGFCGPLGEFDVTAPEGSTLVKGDFTSLYPASSKAISFVQSDGTVHKPLEEWYTGFPDPRVKPDGSGGWLKHDFGGIEMGPEEYTMLKNMHGIMRIQCDQEEMTCDCNHFEQEGR